MTDIKRYDVNKANMIGLVRFDEKESGRWVKHKDHAEIVAEIQEQLSSHSMSAGQADQSKAESDAVRSALGFSADADDVSPSDLVDAIAAIQEQVRALIADNVSLKEAIGNISEALETGTDGLLVTAVRDAVSLETPATDAVIREIRAGGADAVAKYHEVRAKSLSAVDRSGCMRHGAAMICALDVSAIIRAGEQP